MAKRTRNHIIEDESRAFFKKSLPEMWICRDKPIDYGIDCEVEIFNEKGQNTGLVFWVQLKGTNSKDEARIKRVNFKKDKINQFLSYDVPVLIVRYSSVYKNQYCKWANRIDSRNDEFSTIEVRFFDSERWNDQSNTKIFSYLISRRKIRNGNFDLPFKSFVGFEECDQNENQSYSNASIIKQCLNKYVKYFHLVNEEANSLLQIFVGQKSILTTTSGVASAKMKVEFSNFKQTNIERLSKHVLITFCSVLYDLGKNDIADQIIIKENLIEVLKIDLSFCVRIFSQLMRGRFALNAVEELSKFPFKDNGVQVVVIVSQILLTVRSSINEDFILQALEKLLFAQLEYAQLQNDPKPLSHIFYNFGRLYTKKDDFKKAITFYLKARKSNSDYKNRGYFYSEIAGLFFSIGRYKFASGFYEKSISLSVENTDVKALLAHVKIYLGEIQEASDLFNEFLFENKNQSRNSSEWHLWYICLTTILNYDYPKSLKYNKELSYELMNALDFENAVEANFLNAAAWFNLGIEYSKTNEFLNSFLCFTISGLLNEKDAESWVNATISCLNFEKNGTILVHLIRAGFKFNSFEFVNKLNEVLEDQEFPASGLLAELIEKTIKYPLEELTTIRFFDGEEVLTFNL